MINKGNGALVDAVAAMRASVPEKDGQKVRDVGQARGKNVAGAERKTAVKTTG